MKQSLAALIIFSHLLNTGVSSKPARPTAEPTAFRSQQNAAPFCPEGNGLFVLYYGTFEATQEKREIRKIIRDAKPNLLVLADVYYNDPRLPDYYHFDGDGKPTGIRVIMYIATGGGKMNVNKVLARIEDAMAAGYDGIFFDEVSNARDAGTVYFYSKISQEVKRYGPENLVIFNPGTHTVNAGLFNQADIVSVENNTNDPNIIKPPDFSAPPVVVPKPQEPIEQWRWLAVQGHPASIAADTAGEAKIRLETFRKSGGFWYYSPPKSISQESTHYEFPLWFEEYAKSVKALGDVPCPVKK